MHNLIYGGVNSEDYKAYITNAGIYKSPEKRYRNYTVPGRNGKLLEDTGTFENVEVEYPFCVYEDCDTNMQNFLAAMRRKKGYQRIEDTFHPEYYRMGAFLDEFEPKEVTADADKSNGILKFDCMPQKWLKAGEEPICVIEGNFSNYVSSEDEPDIPSTATMWTGYMPTPENKKLVINLHNAFDEAYVGITSYDAEDHETFSFLIPEHERWLPEGDYQVTFTLPSDSVRWSFEYEIHANNYYGEIVTVGDTYAEFSFEDYFFGEYRNIKALLKEEIRFVNPTGFATKPLIEYFAYYNSNIKITNIENGVEKDFYELEFDAENELNQHIFLDCDQQYAYNSDGANVSNIMSIVTAQSSDGKSLVFPEFGSDSIKIEFLKHNEVHQMTPHNTIIFIYPRWWTT